MNKECYLKKINFVDDLKQAIVKVQSNVIDIHYDIFINNEDVVEVEYLVIEYLGGAKTVRNCYGDSYSVILEEISKYLNSGHYTEVKYYESLLTDKNYRLLK